MSPAWGNTEEKLRSPWEGASSVRGQEGAGGRVEGCERTGRGAGEDVQGDAGGQRGVEGQKDAKKRAEERGLQEDRGSPAGPSFLALERCRLRLCSLKFVSAPRSG